MTKTFTCVLSTCGVLACGAAMLGAPAQDQTPQPGQPTQARVWIQNHGNTEAVPVSIQNVAADVAPLRVDVGTPTVAIGAGSVVQARVPRQPWEYEDVSIPSGQDPAALLGAAGADGWEATSVVIPVQAGTLVVMKRPQ